MLPGKKLLAGKSFFVRSHVTSKKPMKAHAVRVKITKLFVYKTYAKRENKQSNQAKQNRLYMLGCLRIKCSPSSRGLAG